MFDIPTVTNLIFCFTLGLELLLLPVDKDIGFLIKCLLFLSSFSIVNELVIAWFTLVFRQLRSIINMYNAF